MTPVEKAEATLKYLRSNGGKLNDEQLGKFARFVKKLIEEERQRYMAAPWHERLRYRLYLLWCRVTRQESWPFGVKVTTYKRSR